MFVRKVFEGVRGNFFQKVSPIVSSHLRFVRNRDVRREFRAFAERAFDTDTAVMIAGNPLDHGQPESRRARVRARFFGTEEAFPNFREIFFRNSDAVILDGKFGDKSVQRFFDGERYIYVSALSAVLVGV